MLKLQTNNPQFSTAGTKLSPRKDLVQRPVIQNICELPKLKNSFDVKLFKKSFDEEIKLYSKDYELQNIDDDEINNIFSQIFATSIKTYNQNLNNRNVQKAMTNIAGSILDNSLPHFILFNENAKEFFNLVAIDKYNSFFSDENLNHFSLINKENTIQTRINKVDKKYIILYLILMLEFIIVVLLILSTFLRK